jgi:hypothetical protein
MKKMKNKLNILNKFANFIFSMNLNILAILKSLGAFKRFKN